jgi:hypothetical protein
MARTSFRVRRDDLVSAPDSNPFGSYVRGVTTDVPSGYVRTDNDSALRADGIVFLTENLTVTATFTATANSYSTVNMEWTNFTLTPAEENLGEDSVITDIVIVYSPTGPPETVRDGTIVKTQYSYDNVYSVEHQDVPSGFWAYYSMFLHWNQGGVGVNAINWYERVAYLQELVPYEYGSTELIWNRIPSHHRINDIYGRNLDPQGLQRGQFQRYLSMFGFEIDRTRTLFDSVMEHYDPNLTESQSLTLLATMFGLEVTPEDIGISRIRQLIQDVGYYRQRKGTLESIKQYLVAVTGCQVDVIEKYSSPRYTFRIYAEKVNLVADSEFIVTSGTKKWDFSSSSASCTFSTAGDGLSITNTGSSSAQFALVSKIAVPVDNDVSYLNSLKVTGNGDIWGAHWSASAAWSDWTTTEQKDNLISVEIAPDERQVILMPDSASAMAYPVLICGLSASTSVVVNQWMDEPKSYGTFFNGDSDFGGFIYQNNFSDIAWDGARWASYTTYSTNKGKTQLAIEKLIPQLLPVTMLLDTNIDYEIVYDWIPGLT